MRHRNLGACCIQYHSTSSTWHSASFRRFAVGMAEAGWHYVALWGLTVVPLSLLFNSSGSSAQGTCSSDVTGLVACVEQVSPSDFDTMQWFEELGMGIPFIFLFPNPSEQKLTSLTQSNFLPNKELQSACSNQRTSGWGVVSLQRGRVFRHGDLFLPWSREDYIPRSDIITMI